MEGICCPACRWPTAQCLDLSSGKPKITIKCCNNCDLTNFKQIKNLENELEIDFQNVFDEK